MHEKKLTHTKGSTKEMIQIYKSGQVMDHVWLSALTRTYSLTDKYLQEVMENALEIISLTLRQLHQPTNKQALDTIFPRSSVTARLKHLQVGSGVPIGLELGHSIPRLIQSGTFQVAGKDLALKTSVH